MAEQLPRKEAARKGHRSSVTRTMAQTRTLLDEDMIKLKQKRRTLQSKLDVLSALDNEILELLEPEARHTAGGRGTRTTRNSDPRTGCCHWSEQDPNSKL